MLLSKIVNSIVGVRGTADWSQHIELAPRFNEAEREELTARWDWVIRSFAHPTWQSYANLWNVPQVDQRLRAEDEQDVYVPGFQVAPPGSPYLFDTAPVELTVENFVDSWAPRPRL